MKRLTPTLLLIGYGIGSVALLLFSYTQVDLNLTLSRASWLQHVQKAFQSVGYYHRVEATLLYGIILVLFFSLYGISIRLARAGRLSGSDVWRMIGVVTTVLVFSYPAAFSYDFFNYLFTAKTVLVYHQNPYVVAPLLFSGIDPWTNFMRWTHLTSAYTPLWIGLSCIPFVFGFGMFLPTVIATKIFIALFYLLTAYGISVVAGRSRNQSSPVVLVVFALQPLVIVESLVSSHNDVVLTACMMVSLIYYQSKNYWHAWFWWAVSVAAKSMTIVLFPLLVLKKDVRYMLGAMIFGLLIVLTKREFLPWYFVWIVPWVALLSDSRKLVLASTIVSIGLLVSYASFLYFGDYSSISQAMKTGSIWAGVGFSLVTLVLPMVGSRAPKRSIPGRQSTPR